MKFPGGKILHLKYFIDLNHEWITLHDLYESVLSSQPCYQDLLVTVRPDTGINGYYSM